MARLESATYEELVEKGDDIPVPTMSTAPTATRPGNDLFPSGIDPGITEKERGT